jgi:hypothetical protein
MADTPLNSTLYNQLYGTAKIPVPNAVDAGTKPIRKKIAHTTVSGEDSDDSVLVNQIDHGEYVTAFDIVTEGMGASAGTGATLTLVATDDGGTSTTLAAATDMDLSTNRMNQLAYAGMYYTPAVGNATLKLVHATGTVVVAKGFKGYVDVVRPSA